MPWSEIPELAKLIGRIAFPYVESRGVHPIFLLASINDKYAFLLFCVGRILLYNSRKDLFGWLQYEDGKDLEREKFVYPYTSPDC